MAAAAPLVTPSVGWRLKCRSLCTALPCLPSPLFTPAPTPAPALQTMLGAWDKNSGAGTDMASKLAQTVSANKLAHSYMAFNTNYHDTGGWAGGRVGRELLL